MSHLADGTLRRIFDEPNAISDHERDHLASCAVCAARRDAIADDARTVTKLLDVPELQPDASVALRRLRAAPAAVRFSSPRAFRAPRWLFAAAAVVLVAFTLTTTGLADSFIKIFEPKQFVPVTVTQADLRAMPDLSAYGTMTWSGPGAAQWQKGGTALKTTDVAAARARSGLAVPTPASLPANVDRSSVEYRVLDAARATFTFDAAKARSAAAQQNATLPPMPANIDGSSLAVDVGPLVMQLYKVDRASGGDMPGLVVVDARAPVVSSTGPSVRDFENYLLAQPGISPTVAAQIRALGDPETMLPVPIPIDYASARTVTVHGQSGLLVGDSTAVFSVLFWREGDAVRAVGGPLTDAEVLAIANSLRQG